MKKHCKKSKKNISLAMDERLTAAALEKLETHMRGCPSCQNLNRDQLWLRDLINAAEMIQPSPGFYNQLQNKIARASTRPRLFSFAATALRPALLRAAMLMVLIFSALLGFFLGSRMDAPAAETAAAVFDQTMNLNAYADMPADSFGAVYDRLLQGELQ
jgi:Zn ribbon nucleic-acid-binding protein